MVWIFAGFVLLLFVAVPGFRNTILVLLAIVIVAGGFLLHNKNIEEQRIEKIERSLITQSNLIFSNILLTESQGSWYLKGRVENTSSVELKEFKIKITFQDCSTSSNDDCKIYGEDTISVRKHIPAKQVRDFSEYVSRPTTKPVGRTSWNYQILDIKGTASN